MLCSEEEEEDNEIIKCKMHAVKYHDRRFPVHQGRLWSVDTPHFGIEHGLLSLRGISRGEVTLKVVAAVVDAGHVHGVQDGEAATTERRHEVVALTATSKKRAKEKEKKITHARNEQVSKHDP